MIRRTVHTVLTCTLGIALVAAWLWLSSHLARASESSVERQAAGDVYCVTPQGGAYPGCTQVFTSIQPAIDAAQSGETIKVAAGTYSDLHARPRRDIDSTGLVTQVAYVSTTLSLLGGYTNTDWTTPYPATQTTTIDPQGQGRGIYATGEITFTLQGITITNGDASGQLGEWDPGSVSNDAGGGLYTVSATVLLSNVAFVSNTCGSSGYGHGGGIWSGNSAITVSHSVFLSNTGNGGGIKVHGGRAAIQSCTFVENTTPSYSGGAIEIRQAEATIQTNGIYSNAAYMGGGIYLDYSNSTVLSNTLTSNTAEGAGGGICLNQGTALVSGNKVFSNTATEGGGLTNYSSVLTITYNTFSGNQAQWWGGGMWDSGSVGLGMVVSNTFYSNAALEGGGIGGDADSLIGNLFIDNRAAGTGGGLYGSARIFEGNTFLGNSAQRGGGMRVYDTKLVNNVVAGNYAQEAGGGIDVSFGNGITLIHTTIADNVGGGLYITGGVHLDLSNSLLSGNDVGITVTAGSTATLEATLWDNAVDWDGEGAILTGTQNWWGDPAFTCTAVTCTTPYRIGPTSAARDRGLWVGIDTDIDGEPRTDPPDLGADEYGREECVYLPCVLRQAPSTLGWAYGVLQP